MQTTRKEPLTATETWRLPASREDMITQGKETPTEEINEYKYARFLLPSMPTHFQQYNINNNNSGQYAIEHGCPHLIQIPTTRNTT